MPIGILNSSGPSKSTIQNMQRVKSAESPQENQCIMVELCSFCPFKNVFWLFSVAFLQERMWQATTMLKLSWIFFIQTLFWCKICNKKMRYWKRFSNIFSALGNCSCSSFCQPIVPSFVFFVSRFVRRAPENFNLAAPFSVSPSSEAKFYTMKLMMSDLFVTPAFLVSFSPYNPSMIFSSSAFPLWMLSVSLPFFPSTPPLSLLHPNKIFSSSFPLLESICWTQMKPRISIAISNISKHPTRFFPSCYPIWIPISDWTIQPSILFSPLPPVNIFIFSVVWLFLVRRKSLWRSRMMSAPIFREISLNSWKFSTSSTTTRLLPKLKKKHEGRRSTEILHQLQALFDTSSILFRSLPHFFAPIPPASRPAASSPSPSFTESNLLSLLSYLPLSNFLRQSLPKLRCPHGKNILTDLFHSMSQSFCLLLSQSHSSLILSDFSFLLPNSDASLVPVVCFLSFPSPIILSSSPTRH